MYKWVGGWGERPPRTKSRIITGAFSRQMLRSAIKCKAGLNTQTEAAALFKEKDRDIPRNIEADLPNHGLPVYPSLPTHPIYRSIYPLTQYIFLYYIMLYYVIAMDGLID